MKLSYSVEIGSVKHRTSILELWQLGYGSNNALGASNADRFDWIYGNGQTEAVIALAHNEHGRMVGMNGLQPRRIWINGREHLAGLVQELVVEPAYRSAGPAIRLQRELTDAGTRTGMVAMYGFPRLVAKPIMHRAGFKEMGQRERWLCILRFEYFLEKIGIKSRPLRRVLSLLPNLMLVLPTFMRPWGQRWRTDVLQSFDPRFDALWERAKNQFHVIGERSAQYLTWRFGQNPGEEPRIIAMSDPSGELQAYVVYAEHGHTAMIRDLFFTDVASLDRSLSETVHHARQAGMWAVSFQFFGAGQVSTALKRQGFVRRHDHSPLLIQCPPGGPKANWDQWYLTEAD